MDSEKSDIPPKAAPTGLNIYSFFALLSGYVGIFTYVLYNL